MTKKLLYAFLLLIGISIQSKTATAEKAASDFFCDTLAPTNVQVSNITMTSAAVSWTLDPNTQDYIIRFRPIGSAVWTTVTPISGQNSFILTGLISCMAYEVQVAKICSGTGGTWSNPISFTTYLNYCAAASTDAGVVHISNVTVTPSGGLVPMVSNSGSSFYTDYRPDPTRKVQLMTGSTNNTITVSKTWAGTPNAVAVRVWIDFNADGIFQASEMLLNSSSSVSPVATSVFTVPVLAFQSGTNCGVAMRVIASEMYTSPVCGTFTYGEVEDYGVYILAGANLSINEINKNTGGNIYPNPASELLNISGISGNEFEIYNVAGQKVCSGKISDQKVDVYDLTKGVYFIQIKDKENVTRLKFIRK